jgi:hypothetical protein
MNQANILSTKADELSSETLHKENRMRVKDFRLQCLAFKPLGVASTDLTTAGATLCAPIHRLVHSGMSCSWDVFFNILPHAIEALTKSFISHRLSTVLRLNKVGPNNCHDSLNLPSESRKLVDDNYQMVSDLSTAIFIWESLTSWYHRFGYFKESKTEGHNALLIVQQDLSL